jgi:hypothetical protein
MKKLSTVSLMIFVFASAWLSGAEAIATTYTTNFPLTENPISEGGIWVGGQSAGGNLWGNCQTGAVAGGSTHMVYGVSQPTSYGDSTAILTGTWSADQYAQGTVTISSTAPSGGSQEAEVRLRNTISSSSITGYEVYCSVLTSYCHIASWGGPNGVWVNLDDCKGVSYGHKLVNGDVLKGTVTGTNPATITMYLNGSPVMTVVDDGQCTFNGDGQKHGPWTSGSPGVGFYNSTGANWNRFGFSDFTASDETTPGAPGDGGDAGGTGGGTGGGSGGGSGGGGCFIDTVGHGTLTSAERRIVLGLSAATFASLLSFRITN